MSKLIDSLCGVKGLGKRNRIQDSYNDVSPYKIAKAKEIIKEVEVRPEDALYEVMDYLYDAPVAIDTDRDAVDVEAKGYYWPNGDAFRSSVVKVNEPGVAMTSLWGSGNPRDLWFIPLPVAEICEIDDPKVTPGYYYLNAETNTIDRIGSTEEDLNKWMRSLDTDETIEAQKRDFARKEQLRRDERRMSAETSRENVEDSASGKTPSFDDVRRILSDEEVVNELKDWITSEDFLTISSVAGSKDAGSLLDAAKKVLSPDTLKSFVREMDESHGISITGGSHFEGEDRLNHLREKAEALKKEVDKLEADPNSDADKLAAKKAMYLDAKNLYEKVKKSGSKVSDAAYNPKFEKLRKVLSDTTIVEELSRYMSSDELEEFTETLTRNYDIDLEEVEDSSK